MAKTEPGGEVNDNRQILVDSDAFVGWFLEHDAHHARMATELERIKREKLTTVTTSYVVGESATVLSHRSGQKLARRFIRFTARLPVIHISDELHQEALALFARQTKKGTSIVDCANVIVWQRYGMAEILSFDRFYKSFVAARQERG